MKNIVNLIKLQYNSLFALKRSLLILVLMGIFFATVQPFMIVFAGAMFLMVSCYSLVFYEERSKMNYLIYSLPVTTNEYILSKYIFGFINTLISILISVILASIVKILGYSSEVSSMPIYAISLSTLAIGLFFLSVVQPAALVLGSEKGRYVLVLLSVLPLTFSTSLVQYLPEINLTLNPTIIGILLTLVAITILLTSYFITCNIFSKKEISY
ncbi:ABC-2 transporter permease [Clostridium sp. NSJ-6]|uniref:ABC-2 transporter permease n=1 Tax=Clostridium hominis TaxID=2763036 RepID=A0ABR7DE16_9CLOT|nr:ABC-2 transporter permease [Clostridium hominis]MBC5629382.1 ABC-2 transporter permease [Clostridium hominis]MDU2671278.1 ABC-2 transporter permease [Clostridium sp.]